jgi:aspartate oxidase
MPAGELSIRVPADAQAARRRIRDTAWQHAGIVRDGAGLQAGLDIIISLEKDWQSSPAPTIEQLEAASLRTIAELVLKSALCRKESRGAQFRTDFPVRRDAEFGFHSWLGLHAHVYIGPH